MMRLQILGNPHLMRELQQTQPELAAAAVSDPQRFSELLRELSSRRADQERQRTLEIGRLNADPFDVEAQRRIEEAIRQEAVLENLEHAIEYSPESFGRVTMLYIPVEVNGHSVKAFVDSGAQQTIMSPECAEACGLMRLLDKRFSGIARGVGTAKILGRVHSAQLNLSGLFLPCSFTIMEGRDVDLLFGLDMLKAHQACIDLEKNVLRIQGREVTFLPEHELPEKARIQELSEAPATDASPSQESSGNFPGSGHRLGPSNAASSSQSHSPSRPLSNSSRYPESSIRTIMDLGGVSREVAISTLDAAGGNVDVAASLLF
jgi:DNA damage-inducible protein 1